MSDPLAALVDEAIADFDDNIPARFAEFAAARLRAAGVTVGSPDPAAPLDADPTCSNCLRPVEQVDAETGECRSCHSSIWAPAPRGFAAPSDPAAPTCTCGTNCHFDCNGCACLFHLTPPGPPRPPKPPKDREWDGS